MGKLGGVVVAIAKTMEFTVTADGSEEVVLGLGGVSVDPSYQRRGFGAAVVGAAFARADAEGKRMLFQTGDALPLCKHQHPPSASCLPARPTHRGGCAAGALQTSRWGRRRSKSPWRSTRRTKRRRLPTPTTTSSCTRRRRRPMRPSTITAWGGDERGMGNTLLFAWF